MENNENNNRMSFDKFVGTIEQRVTDIGVDSTGSVREADLVIETLFKITNGDAAKVTDDEIQRIFNKIKLQK